MKLEYSLSDIDSVAKNLINLFENKIIIFNGSMGSGKTTIISSIVKLLGLNTKVSSPTFSIINEYNDDKVCVYHFDFFRIKNSIEALDLGIHEYFISGNWNFIEWGEKIHELLPEKHTIIDLKIVSKNKRLLELKNMQ